MINENIMTVSNLCEHCALCQGNNAEDGSLRAACYLKYSTSDITLVHRLSEHTEAVHGGNRGLFESSVQGLRSSCLWSNRHIRYLIVVPVVKKFL